MAFRVPTRLTIEPGCLALLAERDVAPGASRAMLVTDPGLGSAGWPDRAQALLEQRGLEVEPFTRVEPNPRATTIEELAARLRDDRFGLVVGLGGGSVLDAAKAAAMLATNPGRCRDFVGKNRYSQPPLPFVAVPTTCGTGSEVTWVSVINDQEERTKISVKGETMFPDRALVDGDLLTSLPAHLVAATGVDALTHAMEAFTGRCANPASDALALHAVERLFTYLRRAVRDIGADAEARNAVMEASTVAGLSFGNADVGPVHCLSEALGGLFDVPHGLTNGLLLAPVMRSHGSSVEGRLAALAPRVPGFAAAGLGEDSAARADWIVTQVEALIADVELGRFSDLGIDPASYDEVSRAAVANGSNPSSPRPMAEADYRALLDGLTD